MIFISSIAAWHFCPLSGIFVNRQNCLYNFNNEDPKRIDIPKELPWKPEDRFDRDDFDDKFDKEPSPDDLEPLFPNTQESTTLNPLEKQFQDLADQHKDEQKQVTISESSQKSDASTMTIFALIGVIWINLS